MKRRIILGLTAVLCAITVIFVSAIMLQAEACSTKKPNNASELRRQRARESRRKLAKSAAAFTKNMWTEYQPYTATRTSPYRAETIHHWDLDLNEPAEKLTFDLEVNKMTAKDLLSEDALLTHFGIACHEKGLTRDLQAAYDAFSAPRQKQGFFAFITYLEREGLLSLQRIARAFLKDYVAGVSAALLTAAKSGVARDRGEFLSGWDGLNTLMLANEDLRDLSDETKAIIESGVKEQAKKLGWDIEPRIVFFPEDQSDATLEETALLGAALQFSRSERFNQVVMVASIGNRAKEGIPVTITSVDTDDTGEFDGLGEIKKVLIDDMGESGFREPRHF